MSGAFVPTPPVWLNADLLGYEFRSDGAFFFAAAPGLFKGLGDGAVCPGTAKAATSTRTT